MRGEPVAEHFRLFELARPARAVLARQRKYHRLVLARAVAQALEVVVEPVNPLHALARGLRVAKGQNVSEEARVDVLLAPRSRVEVEVAVKVARLLQDL